VVADGVHILLAVALVIVLLRTERVEPYLVAILAAGVPDLDKYLFTPLIYSGYLSGPIWTHRGITHSLFAFALFVGAAHLVGQGRAAAVGYGSHLAADFATGAIRLFAPFTVRLHGLYYDWVFGNVVAGTFALAVTLAGLAAMLSDPDPGEVDSRTDPLGRLGEWWFR
jgi:inner membrane protein